MKWSSRFTELMGCAHPIQLAAMGGGVGGPELAAAVRDAGGFGMVSAGEPVPASCGVNFLVPFVSSPAEVAEQGAGCRVVEFFYGDPDVALVACAHDLGALVGWQVGTADEAVAAAAVGCDYAVAQGVEAGGHIRGEVTLDTLLVQVLGRVGVPVVAAGGIATGKRAAEVLGLADAVRVGTRFLTCPESNAHENYVANLLEAGADDSVITEWFDEGWPQAPHRVLRQALDAAVRTGWHSPQPPSRSAARTPSDMAQYAGIGVGHVNRIESAADVIADLVHPG